MAEPVEHAAQAAHAAASNVPEIANVVTVLVHQLHDHPLAHWLHRFENVIFSVLVAAGLSLIAYRFGRRPSVIPSGGQNILELFVEGMDNFIRSLMGSAGRAHLPFVGTLFIYIWFMNLSSIVPGLKPPTASLNTTIALALVVFGYVQWIGIRSNGLFGYLHHLAGSPRDVASWCLVPLMLPLHLVGEVIKPVSLSLRLAFNIFAEDILLAVLLGLGLSAGAFMHAPIPFQFFVVPLVLIFSTVQALVFSLLSSVYIASMLPHEEHGGHHSTQH